MRMAGGQRQDVLDRTLMALADPTRRSILQRLARGSARVTEVAEGYRMSLNSVSKHIRVLERARLVRRKRMGREHILTLDPGPLDGASAWIEKQRTLWGQRFDSLEALLKAEARESASRDGAREARTRAEPTAPPYAGKRREAE